VKHYIKRSDGIVQSYFFKDEAKFKRDYVKAVPHRPRALERKFKKRIRVYQRRVVKPPPPEDWFTCSMKYNFDRWKLDCSCTGQGTEESIKEKLKQFMKRKGFKYWEGYCLTFNYVHVCIKCERAIDEEKVEEGPICVSDYPS